MLNTDSRHYGGGDVGNGGSVEAEPIGWHDQPFSAELTLPPLGVVWLRPEDQGSRDADSRRRRLSPGSARSAPSRSADGRVEFRVWAPKAKE